MPQMEALKAFRFAGRKVQPGEKFTATANEEKTLRAMGWAKPATGYATRVMVAAAPNEQDEPRRGRKPRDPNKVKRQYRRRDMQAENEPR